MPNPTAADYGLFGGLTRTAVNGFRTSNGLAAADIVDSQTVQSLVRAPAKTPVVSRPYVTLVLDFEWTGLTKVVALTSILEGEGSFGAMNLNTDKAGMSYGIIQWAQKPQRLHELLLAYQATDGDEFTTIFGGGDAGVASGLLSHTGLPNGGVDASGVTTDPDFDLVDARWKGRFQAATLSPQCQKVQVTAALSAFQSSLQLLKGYAPEFTTERQVAFMLDLANQYGNGGAESLYKATAQAGQTAMDHLAAIADRSVSQIAASAQAGTRNRRNLFLNTPLLADSDF